MKNRAASSSDCRERRASWRSTRCRQSVGSTDPLRFRVESADHTVVALPLTIPLEYRLTVGRGDEFSVWSFSSLLRSARNADASATETDLVVRLRWSDRRRCRSVDPAIRRNAAHHDPDRRALSFDSRRHQSPARTRPRTGRWRGTHRPGREGPPRDCEDRRTKNRPRESVKTVEPPMSMAAPSTATPDSSTTVPCTM